MSTDINLRSRATLEGDTAVIRALVRHPMENGFAKDASGALIPAHHLTVVELLHNGRPVIVNHIGSGVAKDPAMGWRVPGAKAGDVFVLRLADNKGATKSVEMKI
jgi:sulfur-oxidizing protein SoxZ